MSEKETNLENLRKYTSEIKVLAGDMDKLSAKQKMLALNASIEAARAGEAGRGFNIVAKNVEEMSYSYIELSEKLREILRNMEDEIKK